MDVHSSDLKKDLNSFTQEMRKKGWRGVVMLDYYSTVDMIQSVKNNIYSYRWVSKQDALKLNHSGIKSAMTSMDPKLDCVFAVSLLLTNNHLYIDCSKFKYIAGNDVYGSKKIDNINV